MLGQFCPMQWVKGLIKNELKKIAKFFQTQQFLYIPNLSPNTQKQFLGPTFWLSNIYKLCLLLWNTVSKSLSFVHFKISMPIIDNNSSCHRPVYVKAIGTYRPHWEGGRKASFLPWGGGGGKWSADRSNNKTVGSASTYSQLHFYNSCSEYTVEAIVLRSSGWNSLEHSRNESADPYQCRVPLRLFVNQCLWLFSRRDVLCSVQLYLPVRYKNDWEASHNRQVSSPSAVSSGQEFFFFNSSTFYYSRSIFCHF